MNTAMFLTDQAIIIYEVIAGGLLFFAGWRLSKEKKRRLKEAEKLGKVKQEEQLKKSLQNDSRRN
ncbi:MAG: hypothetical protein Q4B70_09665 [Lachnospiraceae bacterium]|nr:hypothetical protein [Lachnospiraceae bacterium]